MEEHYNLTYKPDLCRGRQLPLGIHSLPLPLKPPHGFHSCLQEWALTIALGFHRLVYFLNRLGQIDMFSKLVSEFGLTDTETCFFCSERDKKSCGTQGCREPPSIKGSQPDSEADSKTTTNLRDAKKQALYTNSESELSQLKTLNTWPLNMTAYDPQISFFLGISVILLSVTISEQTESNKFTSSLIHYPRGVRGLYILFKYPENIYIN